MCNAHNHPPGCTCGFGGDGHLGSGDWQWSFQHSIGGTPAHWIHDDARFFDCGSWLEPSPCPRCGALVFFVRHNGGSMYFDELGWPWPKHACFDEDEVAEWVAATRAQNDQLAVVRRVLPRDDGKARLQLRRLGGSDTEAEYVHVPHASSWAGRVVLVRPIDGGGHTLLAAPLPRTVAEAWDTVATKLCECPGCDRRVVLHIDGAGTAMLFNGYTSRGALPTRLTRHRCALFASGGGEQQLRAMVMELRLSDPPPGLPENQDGYELRPALWRPVRLMGFAVGRTAFRHGWAGSSVAGSVPIGLVKVLTTTGLQVRLLAPLDVAERVPLHALAVFEYTRVYRAGSTHSMLTRFRVSRFSTVVDGLRRWETGLDFDGCVWCGRALESLHDWEVNTVGRPECATCKRMKSGLKSAQFYEMVRLIAANLGSSSPSTPEEE
jgi:hypothetical protein